MTRPAAHREAPASTAPQAAASSKPARPSRPDVTSLKIGLCSEQNPGRCICTSATCGAGMLDAEQAVRYAVDPARYLNPNRVGTLIDSADVDTAVALGPDLPANAPAVLPAGDSGGGGALGGGWLLALALAVGLLTRARPSGRR